MTTITRRPRALLAVAGIALLVSLTACAAPSSETAEIASADSEVTFEDWMHEFESCMKQEGVDVSQGQQSVDPELLNAAQETCTEKVGEAPVQEDAPDMAELSEGMFAFAKCMREAGYEFDDPQVGEDGAISMGAMPSGEVDPEVVASCKEKTGVSMDFGTAE